MLTATYTGIGIYLPGTFPPAQDVGTVTYRTMTAIATGGRWGTPLVFGEWQASDPPLLWSHGDQLAGSVFPVASGTAYEIRVTLPDGSIHAGGITTRAENLPTHAQLLSAV